MKLTDGIRLGPYEILGPAGPGGMGEVYRARDTRLDRRVAIKILPENLAGIPEARANVHREQPETQESRRSCVLSSRFLH